MDRVASDCRGHDTPFCCGWWDPLYISGSSMACRVFLLALATLCIARQAEQTHRNPLGFSLVTAPPRDATLSGVRPRISGAFGCSRVNQGSSQTRKGFRERSRMAELLWQEPLCMTPNGVEKAIAETSVAVKFGSSSEERRKSSAPNARSVGLRLILLVSWLQRIAPHHVLAIAPMEYSDRIQSGDALCYCGPPLHARSR